MCIQTHPSTSTRCRRRIRSALKSSVEIPRVEKLDSSISINDKKYVSFHNNVKVRPVRHFHKYTEEEWNNCWYSSNGLETEFQNILSRIASGTYNGCTRGLERFLSSFDRTCKRRREYLQRVFDEQDTQRSRWKSLLSVSPTVKFSTNHVQYDFDRFQRACQPCSKPSGDAARVLGAIDEVTAEASRRETWRNMTTATTLVHIIQSIQYSTNPVQIS